MEFAKLPWLTLQESFFNQKNNICQSNLNKYNATFSAIRDPHPLFHNTANMKNITQLRDTKWKYYF